MKSKIIYIASFGGSFVLVTFIMVLLNNDFKNIYALDFTPIKSNQIAQSQVNQSNYKEAFGEMLRELKSQMMDSIKTIKYVANDSLQNRKADSILTDSINVLKSRLEKTVNQDSLIRNISSTRYIANTDSTYRTWAKKTAALYEAMDSKKAAKIIQNYSDNVARDILYSMKKKKAAEVLANLNPETASKVTRIQ
jgi:flagellar motility protein MotE (MotC chaperone)